jgi:CarD family transcriptional regulator
VSKSASQPSREPAANASEPDADAPVAAPPFVTATAPSPSEPDATPDPTSAIEPELADADMIDDADDADAEDDALPPADEDDDDVVGSPGTPAPVFERRGFGERHVPPPRPLAKAEVFVEGDHVVYPTHGVGKVEKIAIEEIAGHKLELIHITFEENRMTLRVPVAKARTAGLRKLASRKMFDDALAILKGRARIKRTMWSRRAQEYEAKINSGDPLAIAEVVRDLHRNAGQPDQSFSERQIYEAAMDRLAAELAALDQTDKATAAAKLAAFLKTV